MAATQLDVLKKTYDGLETEQKKEFISNLSKQLKGSKHPAYMEFLSECVQDYNREVRINTSITKTGKSDIQINNFYGANEEIQSSGSTNQIHIPSLVLSIIGLTCFYGILSYGGLPCAIIALVMSVKKRHIYRTKAAMIMSIIAVSIQGLFFLYGFVATLIYML